MRGRGIDHLVAAVLALGLLAGGCGKDKPPVAKLKHPVARTATPTPAVTTATPSPTAGPLPEVPVAARRRSAALPLDQRVGQLFVAGFSGTDFTARVFDDLAGHGWGGIVITPDNGPLATSAAGEAAVRARSAHRIAPLVAGADVAVTGATLEFGPDVDLPVDSEVTAASVTRAGRQALRTPGVVHAIGHFPGQGTASQDPLDGPAQVGLSLPDLMHRDLVPFVALAGVAPAFVVSSASFLTFDPVTPAAQLASVTRDLLRGQLHFAGAAMSDDLAGLQAATGQSAGAAAVSAIAAGIDLVYVPDPKSATEAYAAVLAAVKSGKLDASRVRDACAHVLALKARVAPRVPSPA